MACGEDAYTPKPEGYFIIDFPEKTYKAFERECPFQFEVPTYSNVIDDKHNPDKPCWFTLEFPDYKGSIYFSYKPVINNLDTFLEDSRTLAFKHTIKAVDIHQEQILHPENKVYGLMYEISGNTASSIQFHLTDSVDHFIRGSLYFNSIPNHDSIQPVLDYIKKDIDHLISSFKWEGIEKPD